MQFCLFAQMFNLFLNNIKLVLSYHRGQQIKSSFVKNDNFSVLDSSKLYMSTVTCLKCHIQSFEVLTVYPKNNGNNQFLSVRFSKRHDDLVMSIIQENLFLICATLCKAIYVDCTCSNLQLSKKSVNVNCFEKFCNGRCGQNN